MNKLIATLLSKILAPFVNIGPPIGWLGHIPSNLMPDEKQCGQLEKLRIHHHIPNNIFAQLLLSSSATTCRVQENVYSNAKKQMPNASEQELLEAVFRSRVFPQNPCGLHMTEKDISKELQHINSLDDLKRYFIKLDKKEFSFPKKPSGIGRKLNEKISKILEK